MYGAFGSLTGGMGCFGGGMGMMSPFGMGGSLFSMMGMGGFGYGCGGFGMSSFGMGGFGCGMSDSQYVGTLAGMMGSGLLFGGITQAIRNHKAAKAEASQNLDAALDTLNISSVDRFSPSMSFNATSYNNSIADAITSALSDITVDDTAKPASAYNSAPLTVTSEEKIEGEAPNQTKKTIYKYNNEEYETEAKANAARQKDLDFAKANDAKKEKRDALKAIVPSTVNSSDLDSDLVGSAVVTAVEEREKAEAEFENAKEVVQDYVIKNSGKSSVQNWKQDRTKVDKSKDETIVAEQKNDRAKENSFIDAFNTYRKNTNVANKELVIRKYNELPDGSKLRENTKNELKKYGFNFNNAGEIS